MHRLSKHEQNNKSWRCKIRYQQNKQQAFVKQIKKFKNYFSGGPKRLICYEQMGSEDDAFWNLGAKCRFITAKRCFTHGPSLLQGCWRAIRAKMGRWVCMTHDNIGNRGLTHNSCKCESDRESILLEVCVTNACSIMMLMLEFVKSIYRQSEEEVQRYNNPKVKVSLSKKLNLSCIQWACLVCHHQCQWKNCP